MMAGRPVSIGSVVSGPSFQAEEPLSRPEIAGARWGPAGAESILKPRVVQRRPGPIVSTANNTAFTKPLTA